MIQNLKTYRRCKDENIFIKKQCKKYSNCYNIFTNFNFAKHYKNGSFKVSIKQWHKKRRYYINKGNLIMNTLKVKQTINCHTCGCALKRTKSIKVKSDDTNNARTEAKGKISKWLKTLKGINCKICQTIINA